MEPAAWINHSSLGLGLSVCPIQFQDEAQIAHRELHTTSPIHSTGKNSLINEEAGLLEVMIRQMSEENRKLSATLSAMCTSYDALKRKYFDFMTTSSAQQGTISPTRKRKSESLEPIGHDDGPHDVKTDGFLNILESASSDDLLTKRLREESKGNVSKVYVRNDPADKSLAPPRRVICRKSSRAQSGTYCRKCGTLQRIGSNSHRYLSYKRPPEVIHAAVLPILPSLLDNEEQRLKMCENYGFTQIGEPLPDNITLKDVMETLPKKVFEIDDMKAWKSVLITVSSYALGIFMISKSPWYLLPLAWAWTGTAVTGFFVIGHDCAHKSFSRNKLVEDIVGTLAFLPLIYPYEPWRFKHDRHHAKTNMLLEDTAWHPVWKEEFDSSPFLRNALTLGLGPFRPWMSISHWLLWHFDLKKFRPAELGRVKISLACVFAFIAIGWPLIIFKAGIVGWFKFWFMPWLGYHFWMSTFTMVHHTAPHIPFKYSDEWNAAQAQLSGTVHCNYPRWIEILCHDINVHIPHHISPRIPSYNLRAAHQSLQKNWGKYLNEANWNWRLMKTIMTMCHVYDKEQYYVSFDEISPEDSKPISFLKKVMPEYT